jgi:hypothetical protein
MTLDNLFADCQPYAVARVLGASVQAVENDENAFRIFGGYANAIVGDGE